MEVPFAQSRCSSFRRCLPCDVWPPGVEMEGEQPLLVRGHVDPILGSVVLGLRQQYCPFIILLCGAAAPHAACLNVHLWILGLLKSLLKLASRARVNRSDSEFERVEFLTCWHIFVYISAGLHPLRTF